MYNVLFLSFQRLTLSRDAVRYFKVDSGLLEFPIFIYSEDLNDIKPDYIKIYTFAVVTDYALELSPSTINIGEVSTLETVRTPIFLTNHSLVAHEYAFLNLPKGVRVEPNMGFGFILPKESIPLYLLYSPGPELIRNSQNGSHSFQVKVTTVAEYGGFGEQMPEEETESYPSLLGEARDFEIFDEPNSEVTDESVPEEQGEGEEDSEEYGDDSCSEEEKAIQRKFYEESRIRNILRLDAENISDHSFFKRLNLQEVIEEPGNASIETNKNGQSLTGEDDGDGKAIRRPDMNVIECHAVVNEPYCQLSDTVIQLPSTPCSSFSLFRFRLKGSNECVSSSCTCQTRKKSKQAFDAAFEFKYDCPQIKLEPQSGFFNSGDVLPITIVYRPEFPVQDLCRESRLQKEKKIQMEKSPEKDLPQTKTKKSTANSKKNGKDPTNMQDVMGSTVTELEKYDLFAGEKSLQELINPFHFEIKMSCLIKTMELIKDRERFEIHDIILVCPAVKPKFIYLGNCQEINFDKVFIGTQRKTLVEIQNISLQRISPVVSLLNPIGPFSCISGLRNIAVDPEHVWCQPLTYAPMTDGEIEREYIEIHCGSTNIYILAKGEAVEAQYKITPNYACCIVECKVGSAEELKFDIENLNPLKFPLQFVAEYVKQGADSRKDERAATPNQAEVAKPKESTDKKKKAETPKKKFKRMG
ncbi:hypothetical protein RUM43_007557 [Polyplax serrata]|uniref:CFAP74 fourth Ig-like domain-containing protein n=1 Tax=Polyplax serrata TaxID=468196 RepID=A0AAN8S5K4_POLSC